MSRSNQVVYIWSDPHAPCIHRDHLAFAKEIKKKYGPFDKVICVGDEVDNHAISFHYDTRDPDLYAHGDELALAIDNLRPYYSVFKEVDLLDSNHGSLVYRRGMASGLSRRVLRDPGEVLEAPKGWKWHQHLLLPIRGGKKLYAHHGMKKNGLALAKDMGCCVVQGHFHTIFSIEYTSSPANLNFSMQVGCSFDDHHRAFRYNKLTKNRPIVGDGIIINGLPKLLPMVLDSKHRWTGEVP
jgi:hypothetical protein